MSDSSPPSPMARAFQCVVGGFIILGNSVVIAAVLRGRQRLRGSLHKFIGCLALADLMLGLSLWVREILIQLRSHLDSRGQVFCCALFVFLIFLSAGLSVTILLLLGVERYLNSMSSASTSHCRINGRAARILIAASWVMWTIFGLLAFAATETDTVGAVDVLVCRLGAPFLHTWYWTSIFIVFLVQCSGVLLLYLSAMWSTYSAFKLLGRVLANRHQGFVFTAWGQLEEGRGTSPKEEENFHNIASSFADDTVGTSQITAPAPGQTVSSNIVEDCYEVKLGRRNLNLMKTMVVIAVVFIVCWIPYLVMLLVEQIYHSCCHWQLNGDLVRWMALGPLVGSLSNFVIYPVKLKEYRKEMKNVLLCVVMRRPSEVEAQADVDQDERVATIALTSVIPVQANGFRV